MHLSRVRCTSVGSDAPQSGPSVQFGHKYAPHKFSEQRSFDVDVFVTVRSAGSQHCAWYRPNSRVGMTELEPATSCVTGMSDT